MAAAVAARACGPGLRRPAGLRAYAPGSWGSEGAPRSFPAGGRAEWQWSHQNAARQRVTELGFQQALLLVTWGQDRAGAQPLPVGRMDPRTQVLATFGAADARPALRPSSRPDTMRRILGATMEILTAGLSSLQNQNTVARKELERRAGFGDRPFRAD